ncbi:EAL domain-containing protein [Candidatus Methylobacter oryzae]|uniref:EAL domain-containing protein n=1 Tax=Candidatus Methylobacter oryzae TaxID=2497749 RepID=UPI0013865FB2|nr:EAL domain-containing protein [Candidatus Methylobacter oryzae]
MKINELNILVVEDDSFQRQVLGTMLRSLGVENITEANNGKQALDIIRAPNTSPINVALCDLNMPEMDGMEFLRHLGEEQHSIAIIISSSLDSKLLTSVAKMVKMYGIRLLGTIEKPITLANVKELLTEYNCLPDKQYQSKDNYSFSLDEVLQGIRAKQFQPFFQPKVDLQTGRLVGAEALARWLHPEYGVIGPSAFIPLLEQHGNIDELTFLILQESAAACRRFLDRGHALTLSINLSVTSLSDAMLADKIIQLVNNAGVEPQYIVLEITESAAMTHEAHALENLARLCMNGFALSIDDYGTGYSSMQQLTRIAFSELKIDQSFVKDFTGNEALSIVVESSIDMAHKLQIKSVAEGVETQQDWDKLKNMKCDIAQGYFIAKPMDAEAFRDFIDTYESKADNVPQPSIQEYNNINILIVEDDSFSRKLIIRVLRDLGFTRITDTESAESALKLFEHNSFDLILTDVDIPGLNGLTFIQLIRTGKTFAKKETRIVVLTSFSNTEIVGSALALDINGFMLKPVVPSLLNEKIGKAMSECLNLRPPLAYEFVKTELKDIAQQQNQSANSRSGASIVLDKPKSEYRNPKINPRRVSLQRLRPGMILKDSIYLENGTLILQTGAKLTETSINRLHDIKALLKETHFSVQAIGGSK